MALDPIEAEMAGAAAPIYREKLVSRAVAGVGFGLGAFAALATIGATQTGEIGAAGAVIGAILSLALLLFGIVSSVTRVIVTREEIRIVVGGRARAIPLSAITSAAPQSYRGQPASGVLVKWAAGGKDHAFVIPSSDPDGLRAAIDRASASTRRRVQIGGGGDDAPAEATEEEEGDAEGARAKAR